MQNTSLQGFGLFAAVLILSASLLFPGCRKKRNTASPVVPSADKSKPNSPGSKLSEPTWESEQLDWLGMGDSTQRTFFYKSVFKAPDGVTWNSYLVSAVTLQGSKLVERRHEYFCGDLPAFNPRFNVTFELTKSGLYRREYQFDGQQDYSITEAPGQITFLWPIEKDQSTEYSVKYVNGESATGRVTIVNPRGTPYEALRGKTYKRCIELKAIDNHQAKDKPVLVSKTDIMYCKGVGLVEKRTRLSDGLSIRVTLIGSKAGIASHWRIPPPQCSKLLCSKAPQFTLKENTLPPDWAPWPCPK